VPDALSIQPIVIASAYVLDLVAGDPLILPHPVRWIGRAVSSLEGLLRRFSGTPSRERLAGIVLAVGVTGGVYLGAYYLLRLAGAIYAPLHYMLYGYMVWTSLSIKSLGSEAVEVVRAIENGSIEAARRRLSRIVGRDTATLAEEDVLRAAIETVSENASDGIVAPLFYLAIGGAPLMLAYKAVNTLDSMVGYKDRRYIDFGRASARLDDAANYAPARLTAALMAVSSFVSGLDWRASARVALRDGRNHPSPNSGYPEAAAAGALGVRLGGGASYGGVWSPKPFIGDGRPPARHDVLLCIRLMRVTAFLGVALAVAAFFIRMKI
jgi:adenosylcobinamide-phosphate synthase